MKSADDDGDGDDDDDVFEFVKLLTFVTNCRNLLRLQRGSNEAIDFDDDNGDNDVECVTTLRLKKILFTKSALATILESNTHGNLCFSERM